MAIPVIDPSTSVLGYRQWDTWEYQPFATNAPTGWTSTPLPPGMALNVTTGKISGAATTAGVYIVQLTATNGTGPSVYTPGTVEGGHLTIGIEAAAVLPSSAINVVWDTTTGGITIVGANPAESASPGLPAILLEAKEGDDLLFYIRCVSQGTVLDLDLTSLKFSAKEYDTEGLVVLSAAEGSDSAFLKVGTGTGTYHILSAKLDRAKLAAVLSNYEADAGTAFEALAEFERVEANLGYPDSTAGPATLRSTSRTFGLRIERDQIQT